MSASEKGATEPLNVSFLPGDRNATKPEADSPSSHPATSVTPTDTTTTADQKRSREPEAASHQEDLVASVVATSSGSLGIFTDIELVVSADTPSHSTPETQECEAANGVPAATKRRLEASESLTTLLPPPSPLSSFPAAPIVSGGSAFPAAPPRAHAAVKVAVPSRPAEGSPHAVPPLSSPSPPVTTAVSPASARVACKVPRKTPVSTPGSSVPPTPLSARSPASSLSTSFATMGTPSAVQDPKRAARVERWAELLRPAMMLERAGHEEPKVKEVCLRIAGAIPGDKQEAKDTFLMLLVNLKDPQNDGLRARVIGGDLPVEVLVTLGERDLINPERRKVLDAEFEERAKDTNLVEIRKAAMTSSTLFPCPKCKAKDCTWTQKQTRSADEPMTVFCTCNKCGNVWKKY